MRRIIFLNRGAYMHMHIYTIYIYMRKYAYQVKTNNKCGVIKIYMHYKEKQNKKSKQKSMPKLEKQFDQLILLRQF